MNVKTKWVVEERAFQVECRASAGAPWDVELPQAEWHGYGWSTVDEGEKE